MIANALDNVGAKSMEEKINTATIMTFQVGIIFTLFGKHAMLNNFHATHQAFLTA